MSNQCYHCNATIHHSNDVIAVIDGANKHFCCIGCLSVFEVTHENNEIIHTSTTKLEYSSDVYDSNAYQEPFLEISDDGCKIITLISDDIHCSSCVLLVENTLNSLSGVVFARVNLSDKRIKIQWDDDDIKLSSIIQALSDQGYSSMPYEENVAEIQQNQKNKSMLYRIGFAGFTMMNLLWISIALYSGASGSEYHHYFQWLGFALATPTLFYSGFPFLKSAWYSVKNYHINMDVPISIGSLVTYSYSTYVLLGFSSKGDVYFDTVVNFIFVILIGRYLESSSKKSALSASASLQQLQPKIATVKDGDDTIIKPVGSIVIGDIIIIKPGERISIDGVIILGEGDIDESLLNGESLPINKQIGSDVFAGTINTNGSLEIKASKTMRESTLSKIVELVDNTRATKNRIVCTIDAFIPYFVGTTLILSLATFIYWYGIDFDLALLSATSVLIITCPCAFGLATPMSIAVASGSAAKKNILIKNGDALEILSKVNHVVFDKTGTLTLGSPCVNQVVSNMNHNSLIGIMSAIEKHSEHPLGDAIVQYANDLSISKVASEFETFPGLGVAAVVDNVRYRVGSLRFLSDMATDEFYSQAQALELEGKSCIWCADNNSVLGFVVCSDPIKDDATDVVSELLSMGKTVTMLSGDSPMVAEFVAKQVGIEHVIAGVLPKDKSNYIKKLQTNDLVLMVGDGVNDAPALTQADTSIAIGSGADVAISCADVVVLKNTLTPILDAINLSKYTQLTIKQNIIFSLSYNVVMVPLAMMALVTPLFAAIAMPISSIIVISNASRLRNK